MQHERRPTCDAFACRPRIPQAVHSFSEVLTAVANGLAIAAGDPRPIRPV